MISRGWGGTPYIRVWFSSSLVLDRVQKSKSFCLEQGIICWETGQWYEGFSLEQELTLEIDRVLHKLKYTNNYGEFNSNCDNRKSSGKYISVWYRVRVSESQRHTPTQIFTEYPPPQGLDTIENDYCFMKNVQLLPCIQFTLFIKEHKEIKF